MSSGFSNIHSTGHCSPRMNSKGPGPSVRTLSRKAVSMMIGRSLNSGSWRSLKARSNPSVSEAIITSSSMTSGLTRARMSRASLPLAAVWTSYPLLSRTIRDVATMSGSSSTTRTNPFESMGMRLLLGSGSRAAAGRGALTLP